MIGMWVLFDAYIKTVLRMYSLRETGAFIILETAPYA